MKRQEIENHTRAAFYLKCRAGGYRAAQAWQVSEARLTRYRESQIAYDGAQSALALMWENLGKQEPKRYAPEGLALATARENARKASGALSHAGAYVGVPGGHYVGTWQPKEKGHFYIEAPGNLLRNVVKAHEADRSLDNHGYYDNPFGESSCHDDSGLVFGMVAQLPGKRGQCRYVAGYRYGSSDIGATFDMGRIFEAPGEDHESARHDAARYADSMAESAAERERDYQTASQAGFQWAELGAEIEQERQEALDLLKERRAARAAMGQEYPATCKALRGAIRAAWRSIQEKRQERRELAQGQSEGLYWSWGRHDETGLSAFAESAGLSTEAARKICS